MNLEYFPYNETAKEMMAMLTGNGFYDDSYVAKWLFEIMGMEMEDVKGLFEDLTLQTFPSMATWGLDYHEMKYGLSAIGLTTEERREQITTHKLVWLPLSPARLEKILSEISGRPVTIQEPVRSYVFTVNLHYSLDTMPTALDGIVPVLNRLKPSHLSYILTVAVEPIQVLNQLTFRLDNLDIHASFQNLGAYILLNGKKPLDGTWLLGRISDSGTFFRELGIGMKIRNFFHISGLPGDFHSGMIFHNRNESDLKTLEISCAFYNLGRVYLLNGRKLLDGTWNLGRLAGRGIGLVTLDMKTGIREHNRLGRVTLTITDGRFLDGSFLLDSSYDLQSGSFQEEL